MSLDVKAYRRALGSFATGVAVITTEERGRGALGITVNSFTSVSLDPPLVLWCLDDASDRRDPFVTADRWAVNVLGEHERALSDRCAHGEEYRLAPEEVAGEDPPRLAHALARLVCETRERIQLGDHMVIVGEVIGFDAAEGEGLLYFRGAYGRTGSGV